MDMDSTVAQKPKRSATPFTPLPRRLTESQIASIRALPSHDQAPTPTDEASRPSRIYTDAARFEAEQAHIFKAYAVPIMPSCTLPEPGMFIANDHFGLPILVSRDRTGKAHAFLNICRHRGSKLLDTCEPLKAGRVSCPYHAWTYGADGALIGIARPETFPSADKSQLGLISLSCYEAGGFIWVGLDHERQPALPEGAELVDADLRALGLHEMHVYGQRYYDLKSNWKLVMEPFLEAYHVKRLHAKTVAPLNSDNNPIPVWLGKHLRQTAGRVNFTPEGNELASDLMHKTLTHSYNLFPNTIVVTSPYFISTMVLMPRAVDRTIVQYSMLMPQPIRDEFGEDLFRRSYEFQDQIFREDFGAGELQQEALSCGAMKTVHFGGMEMQLGPYHDLVESHLPASAI